MISTLLHQARQAQQQRDYSTAIMHYQQLLVQEPTNAILYLELSSCLAETQQLDEALVVAKQAQIYAVENFRLQCDLQVATIYLQQGRYELAGNLFHKIVNIAPQMLEARIGLSSLYLKTGYPTKACDVLNGASNEAISNAKWVTNISLAMFNSRQVDAAIDIILRYMNDYGVHNDMLSNALMFSNYTTSHQKYQELLKPFVKNAYPPLISTPVASSTKMEGELLKVGFVSADFNWHPVGYFFQSFLPYLSNLGIKAYLYSNNPRIDSITEKLQASAHQFTSIYGLNTSTATKLIFNDKLDILIDLSGHTAGHRLDIFNKRAAPVQASYLGYTESTGLTQIDYLLTDELHVHSSGHKNYTENIIYFPTTRFCFELPINPPEIADAPIQTNGYLTLGSFSVPAKISKECVNIWGQIMAALPNSRLKLRHQQWEDDKLRKTLLQELLSMGIATGRIEFYGNAKYDSYLASYQEIDVILDTTPFSGGTTTCEALWMGVPTITFSGLIPASRQGVSILNSVDESFWIASDAKHAIELLENLQQRPQILNKFKATIRNKINSSPLGNKMLFAQHFANAIYKMIKNIS